MVRVFQSLIGQSLRDINTESRVVGIDDSEKQAGDYIVTIMISPWRNARMAMYYLHAVVVASVLLPRARSTRILNIKSRHCQKLCSDMYYVCSEESM